MSTKPFSRLSRRPEHQKPQVVPRRARYTPTPPRDGTDDPARARPAESKPALERRRGDTVLL